MEMRIIYTNMMMLNCLNNKLTNLVSNMQLKDSYKTKKQTSWNNCSLCVKLMSYKKQRLINNVFCSKK